MPYKCPICNAENEIVNQCMCDPNNLPTIPFADWIKDDIHPDWIIERISEYIEHLTNQYRATRAELDGANKVIKNLKVCLLRSGDQPTQALQFVHNIAGMTEYGCDDDAEITLNRLIEKARVISKGN